MKIIKLNESQFHRVLESSIENGTYGEEDTPEYESHEEVTTQPTITDKNGNVVSTVSNTAPNTYTITYRVIYNDYSSSVSNKIIIKEKEPQPEPTPTENT